MPNQRKIRFIEPKGRHGRPFNAWITRWPLVGPITLTTMLDQRGYDARVYNENISGPLLENPEAWADVCSADVVGITIMTPTAARGYELAEAVRREAPQVTIALGGVHATFLPDEAAAYGDVVVCGEGETVIEAIASGEISSGIVRAEPLADLDLLPTLDHSLMFDFDKLLRMARRRELYELPLMTSRGCPHGCTYCSVTRMFGRKVRRQSVEKVHSDIQRYYDRGFRRLFFYDDNLTADRDWARELLGRIEPMGMRFNAQARVDLAWIGGRERVDTALLDQMRRAGGDVLYIGYETIDDATAKAWRKGYSGEENTLRDRLSEDTRMLHDAGFWIHAMFVLGPQHTDQTTAQIVDFSRQNQIESMQISVLTPFPGTPLFEEMRPNLIFTDFPADWDYYDGTHCVYDNSRMGIRRLQHTVLDAHRRFYRHVNWRRVRAVFGGKMGFGDKAAMLWHHLRLAQRTLSQWRDETQTFVETVGAKRPECL